MPRGSGPHGTVHHMASTTSYPCSASCTLVTSDPLAGTACIADDKVMVGGVCLPGSGLLFDQGEPELLDQPMESGACLLCDLTLDELPAPLRL